MDFLVLKSYCNATIKSTPSSLNPLKTKKQLTCSMPSIKLKIALNPHSLTMLLKMKALSSRLSLETSMPFFLLLVKTKILSLLKIHLKHT